MATVREDMEYVINLSAVYIAQMMSQAEQSGLSLDTADVAAIEEKNRVEQINAYAALGQVPPTRGRSGALPALVPAGAQAETETCAHLWITLLDHAALSSCVKLQCSVCL